MSFVDDVEIDEDLDDVEQKATRRAFVESVGWELLEREETYVVDIFEWLLR